ncbi:30S ribosomal protein S4 [candidate division WOR-3 bacterium JGI_Cruoil_03_44_89]|uniref:Small ribosomal subunit protein uS4 n=1 Tax=candidate division WOR-3 bacterium JGI_Cruoil_03_44_89 TaxID=1973748 RepID=A0A235BVM8_UNCW3|nr:MAG: 30S ribosomal protein S4 [candidate division WOR-3 bacterium JGI_Cruoil_03_44_89]
MAVYHGPVCRLCRREGKKLFLKGKRCSSAKCAIERKRKRPGELGKGYMRKETDYGRHLREKQRVKRMYRLTEHQFRNCFERASRKKGVTGEELLRELELRLDNVIYRTGLGRSRMEARQLVTHGHFMVNNRRVDIPSYVLGVADIITPRKSKVPARIEDALLMKVTPPRWISFDRKSLKIEIADLPRRDDVQEEIEERLIVELYSK